MKKKQKDFEKWAMPVLKKLQRILLLEHFEPISIKFGCKNSYAECECDYPYQSIHIKYSQNMLDDFKKKEYKSITNSLAHEMSHPITDPIYSKANSRYVSKDEITDERERLTDHIANIVLKNNLI